MMKNVDGNSFELLNRAIKVLPGGVLGRHPQPEGISHVPISGQGARIRNADGKEFIDYSLGGGSLILGYCHPGISEAVKTQIDKATQFISIINEPAIEMAEALTNALPWAEKVRFALSGSEANFFAMRLARAFTNREKILKFEGAYHGNNDYAMFNNDVSKPTSSPNGLPTGQPDSAGIPKALGDTILISPYNDIETTKEIIEKNWRDIAAIIVEPVQRFYGPKPGFLNILREMCDKYNIVLIFDEIVTGFRIAFGGAAEKFGIVPDLDVFGKHIGGGFPLSAIVGKAEILALGSPEIKKTESEKFVYVTSHQAGNPIGCTAGKVVIKELSNREVFSDFLSKCEFLKTELAKIVKNLKLDAQVVGFGPLWDVVFSQNEIYDERSSNVVDKNKHLKFHMKLLENGVMVRVGGRSYFSTAHKDEEIDSTLKACQKALKYV